MTTGQAWPIIGFLGRPHGKDGALHFQGADSHFALLDSHPEVVIADASRKDHDLDPSGTPPTRVTRIYGHSGKYRVAFAGISDRWKAAELTGKAVAVSRQTLEEAAGKTLVLAADVIGRPVSFADSDTPGVVTDLLHYPAHDVLEIAHDGQAVLVPLVAEMVSLDNDEIQVAPGFVQSP